MKKAAYLEVILLDSQETDPLPNGVRAMVSGPRSTYVVGIEVELQLLESLPEPGMPALYRSHFTWQTTGFFVVGLATSFHFRNGSKPKVKVM